MFTLNWVRPSCIFIIALFLGTGLCAQQLTPDQNDIIDRMKAEILKDKQIDQALSFLLFVGYRDHDASAVERITLLRLQQGEIIRCDEEALSAFMKSVSSPDDSDEAVTAPEPPSSAPFVPAADESERYVWQPSPVSASQRP